MERGAQCLLVEQVHLRHQSAGHIVLIVLSAAICELAGQGSAVLHSRHTEAAAGALSHRAARQGKTLSYEI